MKTKNGIIYDLEKSDYKVNVDGITYVFSSLLHLNKFISKYETNRDIINYSLSKRFNYNINVSLIADLVLYRKIETRGFLVVSQDGNKLCQRNITLSGVKVTNEH